MSVYVYKKNDNGDIEKHLVNARRLNSHLEAGYVVDPADLDKKNDDPFDGMTKAELCEYAKAEFGAELNQKNTADKLKEQIAKLESEAAEGDGNE